MSALTIAARRTRNTLAARLARSTALATLLLVGATALPASADQTIDNDAVVLAPGQNYDATGTLIVGNYATGSLTQVDGGSITDIQAVLGQNPGSVGTVTLDGGTWSSIDLFVGYEGEGRILGNDGAITAQTVYIAGTTGGSGSIDIGDGGSLDVSGTLFVGQRGTGSLTIHDGGTVTADTGNIGALYENGTPSDGTVIVDGAGSTFTLDSDLYVGRGGTGTLILSNGGVADVASSGGIAHVADEAGSTGTIVFGARAGEAPADVGFLNVAEIAFGAGDGTVVYNFNGYTSWGYKITGDGTIEVLAGTTAFASDITGFTGETNVRGGTLAITHQFSGTTNIFDGGTLYGSGALEAIVVNAGGTVEPDYTEAPLTVGDATFNTGSLFKVRVVPNGDHSELDVTGSATLNGGYVQLLAGSGNYLPSTTYTILNSNDLAGTFQGVNENYAFLSPTLTYDYITDDVLLTLDVDFENPGVTPNEMAVGAALEDLADAVPYYGDLTAVTDDEASNVLNQLSGEGFASVTTAMLDDSRFVRDAALGGARNFWAQAYGGFANIDGDGNADGLSDRSGGLMVGGDAELGEGWYAGLLLAAGRTAIEARNMSFDSTDLSIGAYGGGPAGLLDVKFGAAYTHHLIDSTRRIVFGDVDDTLTADYEAGTTQAFIELSHSMEMYGTAITPFASLAGISQSSDGGTETGGEGALTFAPGTTTALLTTLGLGISHDFRQEDGTTYVLSGRLGWRHTNADQPLTENSFEGGDPFTIAGTPIAKDALLLEAGAKFNLTNGMALDLGYTGQISSDATSHAANLTLSGSF